MHLFIAPEREIYLVKIMNQLVNAALGDSSRAITPQALETYFELLIKQL